MGTSTKAVTSIWHIKPWWCQPWTIVLSGLGSVAGSWLLLQRLWLTVLLSAAVLLWWMVFLWWVPQAYAKGDAGADRGP